MARRSYEPAAPKPYGFVRVDPLQEEDRADPREVGHDSYKREKVNGTLWGEIHVLSPVHVASGTVNMQDNPNNPLYKAHARSGGQAVIPGSSLKGVVRSVVEAISPSCVRITRVREGFPGGSRGCQQKDKLCVACLLFGATGRGWGFQGRVRFTDAVLQDKFQTVLVRMPSLHAPGSKSMIPYFDGGKIKKIKNRLVVTGGKIKGRKFYYHGQPAQGDVPAEVCPTDSILDFRLHFDNLAQAELGLLLTSLGLGDPPLTLKLGGGKPVCYGSIRVRLSGLEVFENAVDAYSDYDVSDATRTDPHKYLSEAGKLIRTERLQELADLLKVDASRECPEGNY